MEIVLQKGHEPDQACLRQSEVLIPKNAPYRG